MNIDTLNMIQNCWIATQLARELGLERRYFSRFSSSRAKSLSTDIKIQSTGGLVLVQIPSHVTEMINSKSYVISKIDKEDESKYSFVFQITSDTKIGFWR